MPELFSLHPLYESSLNEAICAIRLGGESFKTVNLIKFLFFTGFWADRFCNYKSSVV